MRVNIVEIRTLKERFCVPTVTSHSEKRVRDEIIWQIVCMCDSRILNSFIMLPTGPYTVFVPTDKAFRTLLVQLGGPEKAEQKFHENPRLLSGVRNKRH